ncbi:MAG: DNA primase [Deltaproteobacteria bacterium]|nr:DNA primase [Deltaproteobacteria bacterium]
MEAYQSAKEEIKRTADIVEVIGQYVQLKKAGQNYIGLCPFHGDKDPSLTVNRSKQMFHCFGCKKGGDVFAFWMEYHKVSFPQAMRELAEKYHIALPEDEMTPARKKEKELEEAIFELNSLAAGYYNQILLKSEKGAPGREYLKKRSINSEIAEEFLLGFAPPEWNGLTNFLKGKKADLQRAAQAGLIISKDRGYYDRFRGRVIFPIHNIRKQVAGFGARVTDKSLPKYLNTPETPVFHKGELLYGLHSAYQGIRESGRVVIVEGYTDVIAMKKHGFNEAVATLGTALTKEHVRKLKGYAKEAMVVFDSDAAGKGATLKSLPLFINEDMTAKVIVLPEGDDPDTFMNSRGLQGFLEYLEKSVPIFEFYLDLKLSRRDESIEDQVGILKETLPVLSEVNSESKRLLYVRRLSEKSHIPESIILGELKNNAPSARGDEQENRLKKRLSGIVVPNLDELSILNLLAHFPDTAGRLMEIGCRLLLSDPIIMKIFDSLCIVSGDETEHAPDAMVERIEDTAARERYRETLLSASKYRDRSEVELALKEFEFKAKGIMISDSSRKTGNDLEKKNLILKMKTEQDRALNKFSKIDSGKTGNSK